MTTLPPKHLLSKSTFMYGCQCPKRLWLHKFMPQVRDEQDAATTSIFQQGTDVGKLAQQLFPGGIDATPPSTFEYQQAVFNTAKYIEEGHSIIYEAAFQFEGIMCAVDILVKQENGWHAYEVKSSTQVKQVYEQDAALQYYVITNSGLLLEDFCLILLNTSYVRFGELDIECLFHKPSISQTIVALQTDIKIKEAELKEVLKLKHVPNVSVGAHCNTPYTCDFFGHCHTDVVYEEPDYGKAQIDKQALSAFVDMLAYPLYFLDFETYVTAVPLYDGHWSYRQIVFQYSLHIQQKAGGAITHCEYLADHVGTPMEVLLTQLIAELGNEGSVIVYNKGFENTRLKELKNDHPSYGKQIEAIQDRIIDLMVPFRRKEYYTPEMLGRYSIKNVLPALVPELSYDNLEIGNGTDASSAFYNLQHETDPAIIENTRKHLLKYCEMDTWGMVEILKKLRKIIR